MATDVKPPLLTLAEAAASAGVSEVTIRRWIAMKRLPAVRLEPSGWLRIDPETLASITAPTVAGVVTGPAAVAG